MRYVSMKPRTIARIASTMIVLLAVFLCVSDSKARLYPYYIVKGYSFGQVKPKILFVLDTSGSMTWRSKEDVEECDWTKCETGTGSQQSRIAGARAAIRTIVDETKDAASFAFMTFDQREPPQGSVPSMCGSGNSARRFRWNKAYEYPNYTDSRDINNAYGFKGAWELCDSGVNRPYPYLRYDNLGVKPKVTQNNQTGAIPASPLIGTTQSDYKSDTNAKRKVQWFKYFMGVRTNLSVTTDPSKTVLNSTIGDYGKTSAEVLANVWGKDFYYWPYVDGFPGYSGYHGDADDEPLGVVGEDNSLNAAQLYAPFYLDLSNTNVNPNYWGPVSEDEAESMVLRHTSPLIEGGVDAAGGTPWSSAIGPITGSPPSNNAIFSHSTVASYLKFVTNIDPGTVCTPIAAVLVTDGDPSSNEGGSKLYGRLAALRKELGVKIYVVGFFLSKGVELNNMACAGAGACDGNQCSSPCDDNPTNKWDTCREKNNPTKKCAYLANSAEELGGILTEIVSGQLELDVHSGPGTAINVFGIGAGGNYGAGDAVQTGLSAHTDWPSWKGHVVRELCDTMLDTDGNGTSDVLAPYCQTPSPAFDESEETFGPCVQSREWDAGVCLQQTDWKARRLYTNNTSKGLVALANAAGSATAEFRSQLNSADLALPGAPFDQAEADAIAQFILGKDWPDAWKLPGLANSAPVVVRRVPKYDANFQPTVPVRDPHCSGRLLSSADETPKSLEDFAKAAWTTKVSSPTKHYEYQEAVLVGDDLGILHAFQLDSGNELWGFLPRNLLKTAVEQAAIGPASRGQPEKLDQHKYGVAATLNHGWSYDAVGKKWRHLAVIGNGIGGRDYFALDLAHMSPSSAKGPFELLWTSEDSALKASYDAYLGETWARPALTYLLPTDSLTDSPETYLLLGSGYPAAGAPNGQGRRLIKASAMTGTIVESAEFPAPSNAVYESSYGLLVDPSVGTHCVSRFWSEMQEVYLADGAGRVFRWDQGRETAHAADSVTKWNGTAQAAFTAPACVGTGSTCTVSANNKGDPFIYGPAVSSIDRLDDTNSSNTSGVYDQTKRDQFLVALVSGSPYDDKLDGGVKNNDFHASLYLLVDDHRSMKTGGFSVPNGAPKQTVGQIGTDPKYLRLAVSDLQRTRVYTPFPGSPTYTETAKFARAARPVKAPRIFVTGAVNADNPNVVLDDVEVIFVSYTIYEPGTAACNSKWYDSKTKTWYADEGSTYEVTFRLTASNKTGFNYITGSGYDFTKAGYTTPGLALVGTQQVDSGACEDGVCGPKPGVPAPKICDLVKSGGSATTAASIPTSWAELEGFTPTEN